MLLSVLCLCGVLGDFGVWYDMGVMLIWFCVLWLFCYCIMYSLALIWWWVVACAAFGLFDSGLNCLVWIALTGVV